MKEAESLLISSLSYTDIPPRILLELVRDGLPHRYLTIVRSLESYVNILGESRSD